MPSNIEGNDKKQNATSVWGFILGFLFGWGFFVYTLRELSRLLSNGFALFLCVNKWEELIFLALSFSIVVHMSSFHNGENIEKTYKIGFIHESFKSSWI